MGLQIDLLTIFTKLQARDKNKWEGFSEEESTTEGSPE
jgi:hypothetical protein